MITLKKIQFDKIIFFSFFLRKHSSVLIINSFTAKKVLSFDV